MIVGLVLGLRGNDGDNDRGYDLHSRGQTDRRGLEYWAWVRDDGLLRWRVEEGEFVGAAALAADGKDVLDVLVPSPTPLPPQGRARVVAAGQHGVLSAQENEGVEAVSVGGAAGADISPFATELGNLSGIVSYAALREIIAAYDWPINEAFAIVDCESDWNPLAVSWAASYGLWQIWQGHAWRWPNFWSEWMNPKVNTAWAYELYLEQGWGIWECWWAW